MPPIQFIDSAQINVNGTALSFTTPLPVRPGDLLIACVFGDNAPNFDAAASQSGWVLLARFVDGGPNFVTMALARTVTESDPAAGSIAVTAVSGNIKAGVLVYRDAASYASGSAATFAAATVAPCPSRALATFSDLYVGIVGAEKIVGVTPPAGAVARYTSTTVLAEPPATGTTIAMFDYHAEVSGNTGVEAAALNLAATGIATSLAIAANGVRAIGKRLTGVAAVPGMLGLPERGV